MRLLHGTIAQFVDDRNWHVSPVGWSVHDSFAQQRTPARRRI